MINKLFAPFLFICSDVSTHYDFLAFHCFGKSNFEIEKLFLNNCVSCHRCEQSTKIAISYSISPNVCLFSQNIQDNIQRSENIKKTKLESIFCIFSGIFSSFYPFHWHIGFLSGVRYKRVFDHLHFDGNEMALAGGTFVNFGKLLSKNKSNLCR